MIKNWIIAGLAVLGLALGWQMGSQQSMPTGNAGVDNSQQSLPDYAWENLSGGQNKLTQWQGKVLIVNHWATWCEPCRKEIPMFMDFRQRHQAQGLELIGIAHDNAEDVRRYVDSMGMDYPQLLAGPRQGMKWAAALGSNGSLPLTLVFDRQGQLRAKKIGLMAESELTQAVSGLL